MEAKDTMMKAGDLCRKVCQDYRSATLEAKDCASLDCEKCQLEAQAEISFKAGYEQCASELEKNYLLKWKKAGIREVMEWLQANCRYQIEAGISGRELATFVIGEWQAKLKEWGIE